MGSQNLPEINFAVSKGNFDQVKFLLDSGYSPNSKDDDKTTPLHIAAFKGMTDICCVLLDRGAKTNAEDYAFRTPLFMAQSQRRTETVKFLLNRGANPNIETVHGDTPLSLAIHQNDPVSARILISHGARVGTEESAFKFLGRAVSLGSLDLVKLLVPFCDLAQVEHISTVRPLSLALSFGYLEIAKFLLENGSCITETSYETDETGLHIFLRRIRDGFCPSPSLEFFQKLLELLDENDFDFSTRCVSPRLGESVTSFNLRRHLLKPEPAISLLQHDSPPGFKELLVAFGSPYDETSPEFSSILLNNLSSLKGRSRRVLRRCFGSSRILAKINSLELPLSLKEYLLYSDIWTNSRSGHALKLNVR